MAGSRGSQAGPPDLVFHGWLRYYGMGTIRLGRTIGTRDASVWILRVVGQPFGNQHRVCLLDVQESESLLARLKANNNMPLPVTVRGLLFSLRPGTDVHIVASRGGVLVHSSDQVMTQSASMREAVERLVEEELGRLNPETVKELLRRLPKGADVA
jgi:hypothetical protein